MGVFQMGFTVASGHTLEGTVKYEFRMIDKVWIIVLSKILIIVLSKIWVFQGGVQQTMNNLVGWDYW